jgi:RNA polymerase sigma-70 factor (ECF subfamily)
MLLRSIQPMLGRCLAGIVGAGSVDDVQQEVLITLCRKLRFLHDPELFRPWVYRIATRAAFRFLKREKRWAEQLQDEALVADVAAPNTAPRDEILQDILAINSISPACRAVLLLHFQEELELNEVAAILAIPLGTVKSRLAYGLETIRKHFHTKRRT